MKIEVLHHATIKLTGEKIIYFDPYDIKKDYHDADYIFITHDHYDHNDLDAINKVRKSNTKIIVPSCLKEQEHDLMVLPNHKYQIDDLLFETIPAYNLNKPFHPKEKQYVGYNILLENEYYYIMGDTDRTPEADLVKTNVCFVPIGGKYTMDYLEAGEYIQALRPEIAIPIHYGTIIGDSTLGEKFKKIINKDVEVKILIKENNDD